MQLRTKLELDLPSKQVRVLACLLQQLEILLEVGDYRFGLLFELTL